MDIKNLRDYTPSMSTGKDAKASGGPLDGQAIRFTKAEKETNVTEEAYSQNCDKTNLGGKNTGS
jgi:hypothetical protein